MDREQREQLKTYVKAYQNLVELGVREKTSKLLEAASQDAIDMISGEKKDKDWNIGIFTARTLDDHGVRVTKEALSRYKTGDDPLELLDKIRSEFSGQVALPPGGFYIGCEAA